MKKLSNFFLLVIAIMGFGFSDNSTRALSDVEKNKFRNQAHPKFWNFTIRLKHYLMFLLFIFSFNLIGQCPIINEQTSFLNAGQHRFVAGCSVLEYCLSVVNWEDDPIDELTITFFPHFRLIPVDLGDFDNNFTLIVEDFPATTEITYCITFQVNPGWNINTEGPLSMDAQVESIGCTTDTYDFNNFTAVGFPETVGVDAQSVTLLSDVATKINPFDPGLFIPALSQANAQEVLINGTLHIDVQDYYFPDPSAIYMAPGARIVVDNGNHNLSVQGLNTTIIGCDEMWSDITVEDGASLTISSTLIEDGTNAIIAKDGSTVVVLDAKFKNNLSGVSTPSSNDPQKINFNVHLNSFESEGLKPPLEGQIGEVGIDIDNVCGVTFIKNRFKNLANGILASRSSIIVDECSFVDMLTSGPYSIEGYGIRATGFNNALHQTGLGTNENFPTFDNCRFGIYSSKGGLISSQNAFVDNWIGITARQGAFKIDITENNLLCERFGLNLLLNTANNAVADLNTININGDQNLGTGIRVAEFPFIPSFGWEIKQNDIELEEARYGIRMISGHHSFVEQNTISMSQALSYEGILLDGAFENHLYCNSISGSSTNLNQWGIGGTLTSNNDLACNAVADTRWGINFVGMNIPTFLDGNAYYNHQFAFQVGADLPGTDLGGIIGVQEHGGNEWLQTYTGGAFGAVHYGDNNEVELSKVIYDSKDGNDLTTNEDTPNASVTIFDDQDGNTFSCPTNCPPEPSEGGGLTEVDYKIINGTLAPGNFPDAQLWTAKRYLYRRLQEDPSLITPGTVVDTFFNNETNTTVGQLEAIQKEIAELYVLDAQTEAQLTNYQDSLNLKLTELRTIDSLLANNPTTQDSTNLMAQKVVVLDQIDSIATSKSTLVATILTSRISDANQIKTDNDALTLTEEYELNQQTVNRVMLETIINDQEELNSTQSNLISPIANDCPLSGGEAVFHARALLNDDAAYDNVALCEAAQNRASEKDDLTESQNSWFKFYPNPAENLIHLEFDKPVETFGEIILQDLMGRTLLNQKLSNGDHSSIVNLLQIPTGTYYLFVEIDGNKAKTELLVKVK